MAISIVNKADLNVTNDQDMISLEAQASEIAGWAFTAGGNVVIMRHTPSQEQIDDIEKLAEKTNKRVAMIGGQLALMINLYRELDYVGFLVCEAKTDHVTEEVVQPDGSTRKVSIFKHRGLRVLN